jgi:CRP-like cAMP-binding protein
VPGAFRLLGNLLALPEALLLARVERLKQLSLFALLADEQLMVIARMVSENHKAAGNYLCRQGEVGQELFIIVKGEVEIVRHTGSGPVVLKAREGQVVGEFAILADIPRTADLRTSTNVHYLSVSSTNFRALLRRHPEIAENIIRQLVMKLVAE